MAIIHIFSFFVISGFLKREHSQDSTAGRGLRLCPPSGGDLGSKPGQGTRSHMPQLSVFIAQIKIPHAATKSQDSQINKCMDIDIKI